MKPEAIRALGAEDVAEACRQMGRGIVVTGGEYRFPAICSVDDLDWNHMDQEHRHWIHGTYRESLRIYTSDEMALSLCHVPFGPLRFQVLLTDIRLRPGLFYQCYTLFSLFYVHGILENKCEEMTFRWHIASHWLLKPFHRLLSRMLYRLNDRQIREDVPLRLRRKALREQGFGFGSSCNGFLSASSRQWATAYPFLADTYRFELSGFLPGVGRRVSVGPMDFIVIRNEENELRVWPEACPHGGGPIELRHLCDGANEIHCPWHGQKILGALLNKQHPVQRWSNVLFSLDSEALIISATNRVKEAALE